MSHVTLENTWTFWTSNMRGDPDVQFISQFDSIQVFWDQFKANPVTDLPDKTYMHVFKDDIKPLWEDPSNFCGGHFKLTAKSQSRSENMWLTVLLNMLGEQFPNSELVNGASVMSNQVGNNLVKVWLASTDKTKVQATREFLRTILDAADYMPNVTFVPHKLVVKGAGKKVSNHITEANPRLLAARLSITSDSSSVGPSESNWSETRDAERGGDNTHRMNYTSMTLTAPTNDSLWPCPSPVPIMGSPFPYSPGSDFSLGLFVGGDLSSVPSSRGPSSRCSEHSSMPPSPRPVSPAASYTGSEWEADCGMRLMPPSPAYPTHYYGQPKQRRSWSVSSQEGAYTHNPYSLDNSVIYSNP